MTATLFAIALGVALYVIFFDPPSRHERGLPRKRERIAATDIRNPAQMPSFTGSVSLPSEAKE